MERRLKFKQDETNFGTIKSKKQAPSLPHPRRRSRGRTCDDSPSRRGLSQRTLRCIIIVCVPDLLPQHKKHPGELLHLDAGAGSCHMGGCVKTG